MFTYVTLPKKPKNTVSSTSSAAERKHQNPTRMACAVATPVLELSGNFPAWLEAQGVNTEVARAMDSELGIRDYGVLCACVDDGLVRAELLATARDRLPFGFYAVLRQVVKALQGAEQHDDGTPRWDDATAAVTSSPRDVTLGGLVDVLLALFSGLSRELLLSVRRLGTMDNVGAVDVDSHLISPEDNVVDDTDEDAAHDEAGGNADWQREVISPRQTLQMIKEEASAGKNTIEDFPRFVHQEETSFQGLGICVENSTKIGTHPQVNQQQRMDNETQDNTDVFDRSHSTKCSTEAFSGHCSEEEMPNRNAFLPSDEQGFAFENHEPFDFQSCAQWPTTSGSLNKGVDVAAVKKPYQCAVCEKRFAQNCLLKYHQRMHTGEKPFRCKMCDHSFTQSSHLKAHQRTHTGEKPYQCSLCSQSFSRSRNLKAHQHTHTGKKPYKCELCSKSFLRSDSLKTHQRKHTGEKPYKCTVCNQTFVKNYHLKVHECMHTGEKSFKCNLCSKSFLRSDSLKSHQHTHARARSPTSAGWAIRASRSQSLNIHQFMHAVGTSYDARRPLKPSCTVQF
ncbi:zinc finger and SCAN domain-containing protein 2-like isoform X4 [Lethenteron reissneri]|uniref:zinc finger and SCAN domain-containing protein 2-like isoform X4 n=1 Tax=Lethenteron reissneri TaxID=7753 RepID=UPI002AB6A8A5|nr:zinc finger and SCAN domain-containing protein 2-like isoform X4 [Lethenteron reissneri]